MALVLCTGIDPVLMETRRLILERAGHKVISASAEPELENACIEHQFEIVVIGEGLSSNAKLRVLKLLQEHCRSSSVLELYPRYAERVLKDADAWLPMPTDHPQELANIVNSLVRKTSAG